MVSLARHFLCWTLAAQAIDAGNGVRLTGGAFKPGATAQVTVTGAPGATAALFLLPEHARAAPIALAKQLEPRRLGTVTLPDFGAWSFFLPVPAGSDWEGLAFSLVCLLREPTSRGALVSNRLPVVVSSGPTLRAMQPEPDSEVSTQTIFEASLHGALDAATVNAKTVLLYDLDAAHTVPVKISLEPGKSRTLVSIAPLRDLAHGHAHLLLLDPDIADAEGDHLAAPIEAKYFTQPARFPRVAFTPEELALMKQRVLAYENPWRSAYDNLRVEAEQDALVAAIEPMHGTPDEATFDDCYARWSRDMRYALYLGIVAHVTDEAPYLAKAKQLVLAWALALEPAAVGPWQNSIKHDLAGLLLVAACDLLAARDAFTPVEWQAIERFLVQLAMVVRRQHESGNDARAEPAGTYVKSWDNALIAAIGQLLDIPAALQYARSAAANPYSFERQLQRAIGADGSVIDEYRSDEKEHYRITYPLYHLQALALLADIELRHGENLFASGPSQRKAWEHYLPYVSGALPYAWPDEETRLHYGVAKYLLPLAAYRSPAMHELVSPHEPIWEPHLWRKAASLIERIPAGLLGADRKPPAAPRDVRLKEAWSTGLVIAWEPPAAEDEGDLVLRYLVYRDGSLLGATTENGFVDRGLLPETGHRYEVRAVDRAENQSAGVLRTYYTGPIP